jgi:serine/threonine protein kinase
LSKRYNQYFPIKQSTKNLKFDFSHEFEILKRLLNPNILNLYYMLKCNSSECLSLEYCTGGTIEDLGKFHGPIQPPKLYRYCFQIISAVEYLHQNQIAHRDIKPLNILLDSHDRVKLTDFGFSKHIASDSITEFCSSRMFAAPEIHLKHQGFDAFLSDVYALGATFYTMSQGKYPFHAETKKEFKQIICDGSYQPFTNIDTKFKRLILQMMKTDPNHRPNISEIMMNPIFRK